MTSLSGVFCSPYFFSSMTTAYNKLCDMYDVDTMREIAEHGCASGVASNHIYTSDCVDFYQEHEDEINDFIEEHFGIETVMELTQECADIRSAMNHLCWIYVECVAACESSALEVA